MTSAITTNPSLDLCLALAKAAAAMSRRFDGSLGSFHGLSFADFAILLQLRRAPEDRLRRVDLTAQLGLTPSAVTRALIPLEKIGLVKREVAERDARVGYARLTAAGRRTLDEAIETAEGIGNDVVPGDARQVAELIRVLTRIGGAGSAAS